MESCKLNKRYLLIGSFNDLKFKRETSCTLVDEEDLEAFALKDLTDLAILPFERVITVEEDCDGVFHRVFYGCDLINHYFRGSDKDNGKC